MPAIVTRPAAMIPPSTEIVASFFLQALNFVMKLCDFMPQVLNQSCHFVHWKIVRGDSRMFWAATEFIRATSVSTTVARRRPAVGPRASPASATKARATKIRAARMRAGTALILSSIAGPGIARPASIVVAACFLPIVVFTLFVSGDLATRILLQGPFGD
jgi:hypothetical protein